MALPSKTIHPPVTRTFLPRATSSGVDIPTSTVISIGLGFVAFALSVLGILLFFRLLRVRRVAIAARSQGQRMTFRQAWSDEGGVFGFLTGLGGGTSGFRYAGGAQADLTRIRRILEELQRAEMLAGMRPKMFEVAIPEKTVGGTLMSETVGLHPVALYSSPPPHYTERAKQASEVTLPQVSLTVLIALPAQPIDTSTQQRKLIYDEEDLEDLPELILGTADIVPMIWDKTSASRESFDSTGKMKMDLHELEYLDENVAERKDGRKARWQKLDAGKWRIEGI